jgi:hypothetical protein
MRRTVALLLVPLAVGLVFLFLGNVKTPNIISANWLPGVLTSTGVACISVSLTELFVTHFRKLIKEKDQRSFEEFFGVRTSDEPGDIVLQEDRIDELVADLFEEPDQVRSRVNKPKRPDRIQAVSSQHEKSNRLFKARLWINAHDADGAREIRDVFRKMDFIPPRFIIEGSKGHTNKDAPFMICMGLGFTVESLRIVDQVCKGWMLIDPRTDSGDAVALHESICPNKPLDFEKPRQSDDGYMRLVPADWDIKKYLALPDGIEEGSNVQEVAGQNPNDYGIILRHTELHSGREQIRFVVAGFTAHGTAAAAQYLAQKWPLLWAQYVKDKTEGGDGDFCEIIVGNSGAPAWRRARGLPRLTPEYLSSENANIDCVWTQRYLKRHKRP